jgi:MinD superfamily P-loop ATPase
MRVVFASGKGGTGKTLLATNLAKHLSHEGGRVVYADADVEEPNGHIFLGSEDLDKRRVGVSLPVMASPTCSGCGECQEVCAFNAVIALKDRAAVFPELCHGCGACVLACPEGVLVERRREIGTLARGRSGGMWCVMGRLDVGEARAVPVIEALTGTLPPEGTVIVDAPPGTSCPAMAAVRGADLVVLVTEPTPFGLHDLELAVAMVRALDLPHVAVINRADLGDRSVRAFLDSEGIEVLAEIPFDVRIATEYAAGRLALGSSEHLRRAVAALAGRVLS